MGSSYSYSGNKTTQVMLSTLLVTALASVASAFEHDLAMFSTDICDRDCRDRITRIVQPGLQYLASTVAPASGRSKRSIGKLMEHGGGESDHQQLCLRQFDT